MLGPSGCGKTTLLRIIAGLESPSEGAVIVREAPVWSDGRRQAAATRPVSMMFQEARLLPWFTVAENVALPLRLRGVGRAERLERPHALCATVGLKGFGDKRPGVLSGGMRQRASLARALVTEPQVLLLDEFGALDAMTRDTLNLELLSVCEQSRMTTILVTHSITEAAFLSERVVVLAPRPARITEVVTMPFPRPRTRRLLRRDPPHRPAADRRRHPDLCVLPLRPDPRRRALRLPARPPLEALGRDRRRPLAHRQPPARRAPPPLDRQRLRPRAEGRWRPAPAVCDHPPSPDRPTSATRAAAQTEWCGSKGTDATACQSQLDDLDARFESAWTEERNAALANLPRLALAGRDLRNVAASQASLVDADLRGARLEGADLSGARLEGRT